MRGLTMRDRIPAFLVALALLGACAPPLVGDHTAGADRNDTPAARSPDTTATGPDASGGADVVLPANATMPDVERTEAGQRDAQHIAELIGVSAEDALHQLDVQAWASELQLRLADMGVPYTSVQIRHGDPEAAIAVQADPGSHDEVLTALRSMDRPVPIAVTEATLSDQQLRAEVNRLRDLLGERLGEVVHLIDANVIDARIELYGPDVARMEAVVAPLGLRAPVRYHQIEQPSSGR